MITIFLQVLKTLITKKYVYFLFVTRGTILKETVVFVCHTLSDSTRVILE